MLLITPLRCSGERETQSGPVVGHLGDTTANLPVWVEMAHLHHPFMKAIRIAAVLCLLSAVVYPRNGTGMAGQVVVQQCSVFGCINKPYSSLLYVRDESDRLVRTVSSANGGSFVCPLGPGVYRVIPSINGHEPVDGELIPIGSLVADEQIVVIEPSSASVITVIYTTFTGGIE